MIYLPVVAKGSPELSLSTNSARAASNFMVLNLAHTGAGILGSYCARTATENPESNRVADKVWNFMLKKDWYYSVVELFEIYEKVCFFITCSSNRRIEESLFKLESLFKFISYDRKKPFHWFEVLLLLRICMGLLIFEACGSLTAARSTIVALVKG